MNSTRRNNRILAVVALTLFCFTFAAAPASAFLDRDGFAPGADTEESVGSRFSLAISSLGDSFFSFLQKLGIVTAQDGAKVED